MSFGGTLWDRLLSNITSPWEPLEMQTLTSYPSPHRGHF